MKATIAKLLPILLFASSCGTGVYLTSGNSDDVYYNPSDRQVVISKRIDVAPKPQAQVRQESVLRAEDSIRVAQRDYALVDSTNQEYVEENNNRMGDNNYYDPYDDYYYSNRINRFYRPSMGFGYYDPWYTGMGFGYGGFGYGGFGYYDPFYSDFYSPYGFGNSWYNPWFGSYYGGYYGGYYGIGYSNWMWNDNFWGFDNNNQFNSDRYTYGPRRSMRSDGISGERSEGMLKGESVYARGGGNVSGGSSGSLGAGTKSALSNPVVNPRSSSDLKSESRPSGYRSSLSAGQDPQSRISINQSDRSNSSSYIRSRTGTSYVQPPSQGSSSLRSSGNYGSENRSSYVRPKTSSSPGSSSSLGQSGSYRSSSGGSYRSGSSAPRSSGSYSSGSSSVRSSGSYSSGSSSVRSSGSSGSYSSGSSSSSRSSSSSMSSGSSSSSRSGGGGSGRR